MTAHSPRLAPPVSSPNYRQLSRHNLFRLTAGVTMIELLVAVAIVGILAAVGLPQLTGIYSNQLVINSANEMVSDIKQAQNKALSNDQDVYTHASPKGDCTSVATTNLKYVDQWGFRINAAGTLYEIYPNFRDNSKADNSVCSGSGATTPAVFGKALPSTVILESGNGESVEYTTTSGQASLSSGISPGGNNPIVITSTKNANLKYYICVDAGRRVYAQTTACP